MGLGEGDEVGKDLGVLDGVEGFAEEIAEIVGLGLDFGFGEHGG
jgi:hypothetical protein